MKKYSRPDVVAGYLFSLPWIVYFLVFLSYPMFIAFKMSFQNVSVTQKHKTTFVGIANYIEVLGDRLFWKSIFNVMYNQVVFITLIFIVSLALALLLKEITKGGALFRTVYFMPVVTSITVAIIVYQLLSGYSGPVQKIMIALGLLDNGVDWAFTKWWAMPVLAVMNTWKWFAIQMMIFLGGLLAINPEVYEAAEVDGATKWRKFWSVTLPMLKPQVVFILTMNVINGMQMFSEVFIMFNMEGGPYRSGLTPVLYLYKKGFNDNMMGYASSLGVVLMLIIVILASLQYKLLNRNEAD